MHDRGGHKTLTTSLSGTICLWHAGTCMINLSTKFEVHSITRYEDMKCAAKCKKWGDLGSPKVTGNVTIRYSVYDFLFVFNRNYASILYRFRDTASYLFKFANFDLPHIHVVPPLGVTPFEFCKDFLASEN